VNLFFYADLDRKEPLIQPNRSAEFFRANLRKPFFHAPPRRIRRKEPLIYLRNLPDPPRRIREKVHGFNPIDLRDFSVFICVKLFFSRSAAADSESFFYADLPA
jgi:hypothetical protein